MDDNQGSEEVGEVGLGRQFRGQSKCSVDTKGGYIVLGIMVVI